MDKKEVSDRAALKLHYNKKNSTVLKGFEKAFTITFLDSSEDLAELYFLESKCTNKLQAKININRTILPYNREAIKLKQLFYILRLIFIYLHFCTLFFQK